MPTEDSQSTAERVRRLIAEGLELIPAYTPGRGSFSSLPPDYKARNPNDWRLEFLEVFDQYRLEPLGQNSDEICALVRLTNEASLSRFDDVGVAGDTLSSLLGYVVLEMMLRQLSDGLDDWGFLVRDIEGIKQGRVSRLKDVFGVFERTTPHAELRDNLKALNKSMTSRELDRGGVEVELSLYERVDRGRNLMLHGNISHSFEGELLVLLINLIVLHLMQD